MSTRTRRRSSGSAAIALVQQRVQALAVALPAQQPRLVVDPSRLVDDLVSGTPTISLSPATVQ